MVVIDLEPSEEPHVIFETLNARGTPLLQSDLIKNMLMYEAVQAGNVDTAEIWNFDTKWWNEDVYQGNTLRPRIDAFLNFWLIMRRQTEVAHNDVFAVFRRYFATSGNCDVNVVSADIQNAGEAYSKIAKVEVPSDIEPFFYRMGVMRAGVLTPVLMWLFSSEVPDEQMSKSLLSLESYLVRRMICGMSTKNYGRLVIGMLRALEEAKAAHAGDAITEYLKKQEAWATLWPEDQQLQDAFLGRAVYRLLTRGRARIVLEKIEAGLWTNKTESETVPRNLTIEHVMPQKWREHWKLPCETEDEDRAMTYRDRIVHTIGNLTLANNRLNTSLSNRPWEEKRAELHDHTTLFLNKHLLDNAPDVWDEEAIKTRALKLWETAIKVWPHADNIK